MQDASTKEGVQSWRGIRTVRREKRSHVHDGPAVGIWMRSQRVQAGGAGEGPRGPCAVACSAGRASVLRRRESDGFNESKTDQIKLLETTTIDDQILTLGQPWNQPSKCQTGQCWSSTCREVSCLTQETTPPHGERAR